MKNYLVFTMATLLLGTSCSSKKEQAEGFTGAPGEVTYASPSCIRIQIE